MYQMITKEIDFNPSIINNGAAPIRNTNLSSFPPHLVLLNFKEINFRGDTMLKEKTMVRIDSATGESTASPIW